MYVEVDKLRVWPNKERTINSFDDDESGWRFRFKKADVHELVEVLQVPRTMKLKNRGLMLGEEVMLRGLYEIASGANQHAIAKDLFGGHASRQSFAFRAFIEFLFDDHCHLLHDSLTWFYEFLNSLKIANF